MYTKLVDSPTTCNVGCQLLIDMIVMKHNTLLINQQVVRNIIIIFESFC